MSLDVLIVHDDILDSKNQDDLDNLNEAKSVSAALKELGLKHTLYAFSDINRVSNFLINNKLKFIFNLVESYKGSGINSYLAPMLFESLDIKYTGVSYKNIWLTTNKILTKEILIKNNILTPDFSLADDFNKTNKLLRKKIIYKSIYEDASIGINKNSVFVLDANCKLFNKKDFFIEEYINGREFNVAIYNKNGVPAVLPVSEIVFKDKDNFLDYEAKWSTESISYKNSYRTFDFKKTDKKIIDTLIEISLNIWNLFKFNGYIRVDFRLAENNIPYVLEINANPCIAVDSGFTASFNKLGFSYNEMISFLIKDLN